MADTSWASTPAARKIMQANKSRDTIPELLVRRAVHSLGLRYRVGFRPIPGLRRTADLVFTRAKVAVFVDGCFWHGCPEHYTAPRSNCEFWRLKLAGNRARDVQTTKILESAGWVVLRFWTHEQPDVIAKTIRTEVMRRREAQSRVSRDITDSASKPLLSYAVARKSVDPRAARTEPASACPSNGGTAFPICFTICALLPSNLKSSS